MSRRRFLALSAGTALAARAGWRGLARAVDSDVGLNPLMFVSPRIERFVDDLPILPRTPAGGELIAHAAKHRFHRDLALSDTLCFGDQTYLGPVLEAHSGEAVTQTFLNRIGRHPLAVHLDPTLHGCSELDRDNVTLSVHLHGGLTEPGSDGHPLATTRLDQARVHKYQNRQAAAGLWYHDHALGITRLNVYAGLAGHYLLRDEWDTGLDSNPLRLPAGEYELPLVIQDKIFTRDGTLGFRLATYVPEGSWEGGQAGDVPVVNGIAYPKHAVARGLYRLRVLNGSNLRSYDLSFSNNMRFWLIGSDAGLLDAPVALERIRVAAGERVDLLVSFRDLAPGSTVRLRNTAPLPLQFLIAVGDARIDDIMQFHVGSALGPDRTVPGALRNAPRLAPALPTPEAPTRVRTMTLWQLPELERFPPAVLSLNNLSFATDDVELVRAGDTERWDIINTTTDDHPVHLHIATMRVLSRQPYDTTQYTLAQEVPALGTRFTPPAAAYVNGASSGPEPWEGGWKDTVFVPPGQVTSILVRWPSRDELGFDPDAVFPVADSIAAGAPGMSHTAAHGGAAGAGEAQIVPVRLSQSVQPTPDRVRGYVWHCHVLDHEDHDMMLPLRIEG
jgi:spore coat protein A, manganese oxidase